MPKPSERNRKRRKVFVRTPGGRNIRKSMPKKPGKAKCGNCSKELHGVPRGMPNERKNSPKTSKRPERPYGGNLCSKCMRNKIKIEASIE